MMLQEVTREEGYALSHTVFLSVMGLLRLEEEGGWEWTSGESVKGVLMLYQTLQNQDRKQGEQGVTVGEM